jgi:hypothetical protein
MLEALLKGPCYWLIDDDLEASKEKCIQSTLPVK